MNNRNHQKQEKHFIVDILFVLALFGVFAVSALALVTIGADVYQHTVEDMGVNYESRTAVSYIMEQYFPDRSGKCSGALHAFRN